MDANGFNVGAKAALGTIKESIAVGKEAGKLVESMQVDAHKLVSAQHQQRLQEKNRQEHAGSIQEQKAYKKFVEKEKLAKETAELKATILKTHGKAGWDEYLKVKTQVEKEDVAEAKAISKDENKIKALAWWCFGAAAVIVYFLTIYQ